MAKLSVKQELEKKAEANTLHHKSKKTKSIKEEKGMIETRDITAYPLSTTEAVSSLPATPKNGLVIRMAQRLLALHDSLAGPPMTERERTQRKIAAAQRERRKFYDFF